MHRGHCEYLDVLLNSNAHDLRMTSVILPKILAEVRHGYAWEFYREGEREAAMTGTIAEGPDP